MVSVVSYMSLVLNQMVLVSSAEFALWFLCCRYQFSQCRVALQLLGGEREPKLPLYIAQSIPRILNLGFCLVER